MPTTEMMIQALIRHRNNPGAYPEDEFWKLVERHRAELLAQAHAIVKNLEDAEDVVQETLRLAFVKLPEMKDVERVAKWMRTINRNIAMHVVRRKRIERKATQRLEALKEPSSGVAEAGSEAEELRAAVIRAVDALPDSLRPVILLRHLEELSYEQIAERLGVPLGTVKSRIARADSILQRKLKRFVRSFEEDGVGIVGASDAGEDTGVGGQTLQEEGG